MQAASYALDGFLLEYLQERAELAGEYPQRVADERAAQAAYRAEHDRRADLRASDRAVALARAQLAEFQRTSASRWRVRRSAGEREGPHQLKRESARRYVNDAPSAG